MKKSLKSVLIIFLAAACAFSVQVTAYAAESPIKLEDVFGGVGGIKDIIESILNPTTAPAETTTQTQETTTADPNSTTTNNPVSNTGSGTISTTEPPTKYTPVEPNGGGQNNEEPTAAVTTTLPGGENGSLTYEGSLSDLFENDSAAIIIQTPTETFTLNTGLVVDNNNGKSGLSWQQISLIAAAVLFVILVALVAALLVQRNKRLKEEEEDERRRRNNAMAGSANSQPVSVEVMTPERIAELLGAGAASRNGGYSSGSSAPADMSSMSAEESAAAIKAAILMGQLSTAYSDPLMKKYTDEPVVISPVSKVNLDGNVTGAEILEATDSMLDDITGNEKYAQDISGVRVSEENLDDILGDTTTKVCPDCGGAVSSSDVFCHGCGAYVG